MTVGRAKLRTLQIENFKQILHAGKLLMVILVVTFRTTEGNLLPKHKSEVSRDFCLEDKAILTCDSNHILNIKSSLYGRMRSVSHCVTGGATGCHAEATERIDQCCSGRQNCSFNVRDLLGKYETNCGELKEYLQVKYICIPAVTPTRCRDSVNLIEKSGYFSYPSPTILPLGNSNCPWKLTAKLNQRINIFLKLFTRDNCKIDNSETISCTSKIVQFKETGYGSSVSPSSSSPSASSSVNRISKQKVDICQRSNHRHSTLLYKSDTHELEIYFLTKDVEYTVLFYYEVVGCPAIETPTAGWVQQNSTMAKVQCTDSRETWYLTCKGNKWNGLIGNCSSVLNGQGMNDPAGTFPYSIVMAVFLGVLIGVIIGIFMLGFVYLWYRRKPRNEYQDPDGLNASYYTGGGADYKGMYTYSSNTNNSHHHHHQQQQQQQNDLNGGGGGGVGYELGSGGGLSSDYTAYHTSTCPSHSHSSLYGKYMGIIPPDDSGHTLITHCPHSSDGLTSTTTTTTTKTPTTGSSAVDHHQQQQPHCNTGSGRHVTCYYDCGNRTEKV